ncbi:MAG: hypothetical protein K6E20_04565 [Acholeplasmatales bacterium]|nr:hypothetical protein [Acholeplasmatales bacterium]
MNREEFNEMRKEFGDYVYNYEYFQKVGYITDMYYTNKFSQELIKIQKLEIENIVMSQSLDLFIKGEKLENIKNYCEESKNRYSKDYTKFSNKIIKAEQFIKHHEKMSEDEKKEFEQEYLKFCIELHPVVKCKVNKEENEAYLILRDFYFTNNYSGFKEFLELHKDAFKPVEYLETEFNTISSFYLENKTRINTDYNKRHTLYPYNKDAVLKDEISIAREQGELHVNITNLIRTNKELHEKFKAQFGYDYSVE